MILNLYRIANTQPLSLATLLVLLLSTQHLQPCHAQDYHEAKRLQDDLLKDYTPDIRPLLDQKDTLFIWINFELVSLVEVNDVFQSFECNGFLGMYWFDQLLRWNASEYDGQGFITPKVGQIYRPKVILMNTLGQRDLFTDDKMNLNVDSSGFVSWTPGSIFPASCELNLEKYPFDEQTCSFNMAPMNFGPHQLFLIASQEEVGLNFFTPNGEWDIMNTSLVSTIVTVSEGFDISYFTVSFTMKRKPKFLILSILLPTLFLSLLNLMVFVIPVDSGEKISYGITVLLALAVFMSIMSAMLPRSSESMPLIIYYIFILMTISVLTVVVSIVIVKLHHMEEKEEDSLKSQAAPISTPRVRSIQQVAPIDSLLRIPGKYQPDRNDSSRDINRNTASGSSVSAAESAWGSAESFLSHDESKARVNKFKVVGKYIDTVSLLVFSLTWLGVTLGFTIEIAT